MIKRSVVIISLLCIVLFVGLFQVQYPTIYEGFTESNQPSETNLGNYSTRVKYLVLKYDKLPNTKNSIRFVKMYVMRNGNIEMVDILGKAKVKVVDAKLDDAKSSDKTVISKSDNDVSNILSDDARVYKNSENANKMIMFSFPTFSFKAHELNKILIQTEADGFQYSLRSFALYDTNKSLINETEVTLKNKDQFDEEYTKFLFFNEAHYQHTLPKEYATTSNDEIFVQTFNYSNKSENKVNSFDEETKSYSSIQDSKNPVVHVSSNLNNSISSHTQAQSGINDYMLSDAQLSSLHTQTLMNGSNNFRDAFTKLGSYFDAMINEKISSSSSLASLNPNDPTQLAPQTSSGITYKDGEYSSNDFYGSASFNKSNIGSNSSHYQNSTKSTSISNRDKNEQVYVNQSQVTRDNSANTQNYSVGTYGETGINNGVDISNNSMSYSKKKKKGESQNAINSSVNALDSVYNNNSKNVIDNSIYSYNNASNYNRSVLDVVSNDRPYVISGSTGVNIISEPNTSKQINGQTSQ